MVVAGQWLAVEGRGGAVGHRHKRMCGAGRALVKALV